MFLSNDKILSKALVCVFNKDSLYFKYLVFLYLNLVKSKFIKHLNIFVNDDDLKSLIVQGSPLIVYYFLNDI